MIPQTMSVGALGPGCDAVSVWACRPGISEHFAMAREMACCVLPPRCAPSSGKIPQPYSAGTEGLRCVDQSTGGPVLGGLFDEQAMRTPDATALVCGSERLTSPSWLTAYADWPPDFERSALDPRDPGRSVCGARHGHGGRCARRSAGRRCAGAAGSGTPERAAGVPARGLRYRARTDRSRKRRKRLRPGCGAPAGPAVHRRRRRAARRTRGSCRGRPPNLSPPMRRISCTPPGPQAYPKGSRSRTRAWSTCSSTTGPG